MTKARVSQAIILAGGLGTRLGDLTQQIPKPLLPVGPGAFMDVLVNELARHGVTDVLISAGHLGEKLREHYRAWYPRAGLSCSVRVAIEPEPLGTAGALRYLGPELESEFLLLNGDSWFDFDWLDFLNRPLHPSYLAKLALREVEDVARYGSVEVEGDRVAAFREKGPSGPGLISGGVYHLSRGVLDWIEPGFCSLEHSVLPPLVDRGAVGGWVYDGYFIDIGTPDSYGRAQREVPKQFSRPAVVFRMKDLSARACAASEGISAQVSADGVEAFRLVRDAGGYVFVLATQINQADGEFPDINPLLRSSGVQADCVLSLDGEDSVFETLGSVLEDWGGRGSGTLLVGHGELEEVLARQLGIGFVDAMAGQISNVLRTKFGLV